MKPFTNGADIQLQPMQIMNKRFGVMAAFVPLLILLAVSAMVTRHQVDVQTKDRDSLAQTQRVILELTRIESVVKDAETGQRGFLYTNDPQYLAPYNLAISQVEPHLHTLKRLTQDNPQQQARIPTLRALCDKKLKELAQTIALHQAGKKDQAHDLVMSDIGQNYTDQIRTLVQSMQGEERFVADERRETFSQSEQKTIWCIYLSSFIAVLGLTSLAYYILREMNLRELHARQIAAREEWFRVTLVSLGDAVIATDEEGQVTFVNPVAEQLTGWTSEAARGLKVEEVFPIFNEYTQTPVENPVKKVMEKGGIVGLANHTVLRHTNGSLTAIEDSAAPIRDDLNNLIGVVLVFRDASHERKSQEILRKTEKLAAAARLAATFAHEINNPLEAVVNLIFIVKNMQDLPPAAFAPLEMADHELQRVSHITRQTLGFYRESSVRVPVELPVVIENVIKLYSNKFRNKNIQVERNFEPCPPIQGLTGELTQAISNLISNAADAVGTNGLIRIDLATVESKTGHSIRLIIEDNGPGINPDFLNRIFEPFFTTKADVGTGLGLWVTREIIDRHGGSIEVASGIDTDGCGARFTVLLPCNS